MVASTSGPLTSVRAQTLIPVTCRTPMTCKHWSRQENLHARLPRPSPWQTCSLANTFQVFQPLAPTKSGLSIRGRRCAPYTTTLAHAPCYRRKTVGWSIHALKSGALRTLELLMRVSYVLDFLLHSLELPILGSNQNKNRYCNCLLTIADSGTRGIAYADCDLWDCREGCRDHYRRLPRAIEKHSFSCAHETQRV